MKKYVNPEIKTVLFDAEQILTVSDVTEYNTLTRFVNDKEGRDYGTQSVSIFDN